MIEITNSILENAGLPNPPVILKVNRHDESRLVQVDFSDGNDGFHALALTYTEAMDLAAALTREVHDESK